MRNGFPPFTLKKKWGKDPNNTHNKSKAKKLAMDMVQYHRYYAQLWILLQFREGKSEVKNSCCSLQRNLRFPNLTYCESEQTPKMLKFSTKAILKLSLGAYWKINCIATVFPTMELYFKILNRNLFQHNTCI